MKNQWFDVMTHLKKKHSDITQLLSGRKIAYLDTPWHFNIGDLLIYLGTEKYFEEKEIDVVYRSDWKNISYRKVNEVDTIVCHGGGNFGDIYPVHQMTRETLVTKFPEKRIVFLPQTIHFSEKRNEKRAGQILASHKDLHVFSRDRKSFETAKEMCEKCYLMPDMAHSLHPLKEVEELDFDNTNKSILNMKRNDIESRGQHGDLLKKSFDWTDMITNADRFSYILCRIILKVDQKKASALWRKTCDNLFFNSRHYFDFFNVIHTDRLHGLILSCLLGKRAVIHDNSYGKNSSYYSSWLSDLDFIQTGFD